MPSSTSVYMALVAVTLLLLLNMFWAYYDRSRWDLSYYIKNVYYRVKIHTFIGIYFFYA